MDANDRPMVAVDSAVPHTSDVCTTSVLEQAVELADEIKANVAVVLQTYCTVRLRATELVQTSPLSVNCWMPFNAGVVTTGSTPGA